MSDFESKGQRFVALCMLGMLLFNYPILALFNVSGAVLGVPVVILPNQPASGGYVEFFGGIVGKLAGVVK